MSRELQDLLARIQLLPQEDRLILEEHLAQLAETNTALGNNEKPSYALRGSVIRYDNPTEPVVDTDWEATQ